jgi:hypothetical protein
MCRSNLAVPGGIPTRLGQAVIAERIFNVFYEGERVNRGSLIERK